MAGKKELTVHERISKEYKRIKKEYKDMPQSLMNILDKTISNTATLEIRIEDLSEFLHEHGYTEPFTQSPNTPPYDRERVQTKEYKDFIKLNQANYKVLSDVKSKQLATQTVEQDDGFDDFISRSDGK